MAEQLPTSERLAQDLEAAGAPGAMIARAREGYYDDFRSELAFPCVQLVTDLRAAGLHALAARATQGEWDATPAEADAWARSPEGRQTFGELLRGNRAERRRRR